MNIEIFKTRAEYLIRRLEQVCSEKMNMLLQHYDEPPYRIVGTIEVAGNYTKPTETGEMIVDITDDTAMITVKYKDITTGPVVFELGDNVIVFKNDGSVDPFTLINGRRSSIFPQKRWDNFMNRILKSDCCFKYNPDWESDMQQSVEELLDHMNAIIKIERHLNEDLPFDPCGSMLEDVINAIYESSFGGCTDAIDNGEMNAFIDVVKYVDDGNLIGKYGKVARCPGSKTTFIYNNEIIWLVWREDTNKIKRSVDGYEAFIKDISVDRLKWVIDEIDEELD